MVISPEEVGYWYFRLNGFLTIPNFVLHPDGGGNQLTDIDVIGVRFPYRAELLINSMQDDRVFTAVRDKPFVVFSEIKHGRCDLNPTLRAENDRNIYRLLRAVGVFPITSLDEIAHKIYTNGSYVSDSYHVSICCLGSEVNEFLQESLPELKQILWVDILHFIYDRFRIYRSRKSNHRQWDNAGKILWNVASNVENVDEFISFIEKLWRVSRSH